MLSNRHIYTVIFAVVGFMPANSLLAADPFVGVYGSLSQAAPVTSSKEQAFGKGVQLGLFYPEQRVVAQLRFHNWNEAQTRIISANYDRLWSLTEPISVFAGVQGSLVDFELGRQHQTKNYATGFGLGLQAGAFWSLSSNWLLEAGFKQSYFWVEERSSYLGRVRLGGVSEGFISLIYRTR